MSGQCIRSRECKLERARDEVVLKKMSSFCSSEERGQYQIHSAAWVLSLYMMFYMLLKPPPKISLLIDRAHTWGEKIEGGKKPTHVQSFKRNFDLGVPKGPFGSSRFFPLSFTHLKFSSLMNQHNSFHIHTFQL